MTTGSSATGARRRVGITVRRLRCERGLSTNAVRDAMQWSLSKLVRIEAGVVSLSANDLKSLLQFYDVHDDAAVTALRELARTSRQRHWAAPYREHLTQAYMDLLDYEDGARLIRTFHGYLVPELLQTEAYARTVVAGTPGHPDTPDAIEAHVRVRIARQQRLLARTEPVEVVVAIDEAALQRTVGGHAVMREQIEHLRAAGSRDNIRLMIIPVDLPAHPATTNAFGLMEFASPDEPALVYHEQAVSDVALLEEPATVRAYRAVLDQLDGYSLTGTEAIRFLTALPARYERAAPPAQ